MKNYGVIKKTVNKTILDQHLEDLDIQGFTILEDVLGDDEQEIYRNKIEAVYKQQEEEFGVDNLEAIQESNIARCLLAYDDYFINMIKHPGIIEILQATLGDNYILTLQNAIINRPEKEHHQTAWHRDLPYQDYIVSEPLGINIYFCIDQYNKKTGSSVVLPFSHRLGKMPSDEYMENHQLSVTAKAGSVIVFNTFLYHRAGHNTSDNTRRGVNHLYARPIIRQQIDMPRFLDGKFSDDPYLSKVLGYQWQSETSVTDYRNHRLKG